MAVGRILEEKHFLSVPEFKPWTVQCIAELLHRIRYPGFFMKTLIKRMYPCPFV